MKKSLAFVMAIMFAVTVLLSGCSQPSGGNQAQKSAAKSNEPVKISLLREAGDPYPKDKDLIVPQLNKDLNMNLDFNTIATDYDQQLNVKMAGGSPPDLFQVSKEQLTTFARQGILLDLGKYIDQMPNIKKAYKQDYFNMGKVDGKMMALASRPYLPYATYWIRKDWLDSLHLQMPKTLDELKAVAAAFTDKDPDGNGKKDTYGMTSLQFLSFEPIFANYGIGGPGSYTIKDNKVVYSSTDPAMKQALTFIKDLIATGSVDPEIMANKAQAAQQKAIQGKAGIIYVNWFDLRKQQFVDQIKSINPKAEWVPIEALQGPAGTYQGLNDLGATPGLFALPKSLEKTPDKLNKVLEYLNYITGDGKGQNLVSFGIENKHYKMENGSVVKLPAMTELNYTYMLQLTGRDENYYLNVKFPDDKQVKEFAATQPRLNTYNSFIPIPGGVVVGDKTRYETEEITKFIYGKRPLSEFDDFVKTLNDTYKLPLYLTEAEKTLKSLGYIK